MPTSPARILFIDDDPAFGRLVQRIIARQGRDIEHVPDAEAGLARIAAGGIDVLVLDHYLASGTGLELLARVNAMPEPPPVVYVTGSTDAALAVAALKAGAADYVLKTVGEDFFQLLRSAIEQAIETARLRRAREKAVREIREARDRAEMALSEVNHRVANSLALVAALVRLQMSAVADPAAKHALAETQGRISAIAGIHRRLYTSDDVSRVQIDDYLVNLVADLRVTMGNGSHITLSTDIAPLTIPTDRAVSLGVIVNELVTNALKYAYPSGISGEIRVVLRAIAGTADAELRVEDDGVGWDGQGPAKGTGVGSKVIAATAAALDSQVDYLADGHGTRTRIVFSLQGTADD